MQWVGLELLCGTFCHPGTFCHTHKHTCTYTYPFKVTKRVKFDALVAGFVTISVVKRAVVTKHAVTKRVKFDALAARFVTISVVTKGDKTCRGDKTRCNRSAAK